MTAVAAEITLVLKTALRADPASVRTSCSAIAAEITVIFLTAIQQTQSSATAKIGNATSKNIASAIDKSFFMPNPFQKSAKIIILTLFFEVKCLMTCAIHSSIFIHGSIIVMHL